MGHANPSNYCPACPTSGARFVGCACPLRHAVSNADQLAKPAACAMALRLALLLCWRCVTVLSFHFGSCFRGEAFASPLFLFFICLPFFEHLRTVFRSLSRLVSLRFCRRSFDKFCIVRSRSFPSSNHQCCKVFCVIFRSNCMVFLLRRVGFRLCLSFRISLFVIDKSILLHVI